MDKNFSFCVGGQKEIFFLQLHLEAALREQGDCPKCKCHMPFFRRQEQRGLKRHISYSSEELLERLLKPFAQGEYVGCARTFNGLAGETWMSEGSQETQGWPGTGQVQG